MAYNDPVSFDVLSRAQWDATPSGTVISRPVSESISETMDRAPLGSMYDIVYAVLTQRMKALLDPDSPVSALLLKGGIIPQAINFRAVNNGVIPNSSPAPNAGTGSMARMSSVFGTQPDERIPTTLPMETGQIPYAPGQSPGLEANKGVVIARLFADIGAHLPVVLFNVTSKTTAPIGIGGSAKTRTFLHKGQTIYELGYQATLSVEVMVAAGDEVAASNLQMIVEAAFGLLRDVVGTGAAVGGKSWQMMMPLRVSPGTINEADAPWSNGDDKGGKIYLTTVGLEDIRFEAFAHVAKNTKPLVGPSPTGGADRTLSVKTEEETSADGPLRLKLGDQSLLRVSGMPTNGHLTISQMKKVVDVVFQGGRYIIVAKKTGTAVLLVYGAPMAVPVGVSANPVGRAGEPLYQREVVVTAV